MKSKTKIKHHSQLSQQYACKLDFRNGEHGKPKLILCVIKRIIHLSPTIDT